MLGLLAISGNAVSALGGDIFLVSLSETTTLSDTRSGTLGFFCNTTDTVSATDAIGVLANLVGANTENITITVAENGLVSYDTLVTETTNINENSSGYTGFFMNVEDLMTFLAYAEAEGWIRIDNTQTNTWVMIDNYQG
jgi:hypothetical protein